MSSKLFAARRSNSKTSLVVPSFYPDSILRLNVGGKRFDTRLRTLLADKNGPMFALFSPLLEPGNEYRHPQKDDEGAFFLDFDPDEFRTLLNNLRFLAQFQDPESDKIERKESVEKDDEDTRSTRSTGLWSRLSSKKNSVQN